MHILFLIISAGSGIMFAILQMYSKTLNEENKIPFWKGLLYSIFWPVTAYRFFSNKENKGKFRKTCSEILRQPMD
ncbi:hypothetical protein L1267_20345 [Pseudoalteromonas sp. OFAV1]|jgi:hypothetical protein|uniref:hypothetical protein n=1 Tax=Pseudoalteromonas sp. OFAV1 TaxID=2908892 RepID=UPI001F2D34BA|nr:hypothetical protein [Pseudoalteromonas sp. OFAV1]MCF2902724.1 hypothetical protein [Pseudoalteromonas sp. OFAV1]